MFVLGVPTHVAVGTDLFEIVISAGYGTLSHGAKGNVDILVALVMHTGAAIGAQIGATLTHTSAARASGWRLLRYPNRRGVVIYGLVTGHDFK